MAVLDLIDNLSNSIDKKEFSVGVFIDLSKAFDTVNHKILIDKLMSLWDKRNTITLVLRLPF